MGKGPISILIAGFVGISLLSAACGKRDEPGPPPPPKLSEPAMPPETPPTSATPVVPEQQPGVN